ncbi:hypothetical protein TGME49_262933 [Toxoplasma gondii ME49]|uniref:Uncharacterized protein n=3 Tax=Toxoplasma gondii TaxID=5811 RepID=S8GMC0_TOXGM|nr:hypothetical protein TGME49_262933 [Toxoplasma gondii ME49]EPT29684.1 hypothetical protein TGME49_262933 [Toxoplasma gondii ME49]KYF40725.1 hypothetical protein TGARI_262933 [Toxoplasma gondii ARI]|eukprot:XP_018637138.1 hypothetical protein TGME49_262933 [Toxoplasma gondii ME49]
MAAMVSFASSLRCKSVGDDDRRDKLSKDRDRDGTGVSDFPGPFTPYTLQTQRGKQSPPHLPQRARSHVSPVGQYIRRSIYAPEEAGPTPRTPRSSLTPSAGRTHSQGKTKFPQSSRVRTSASRLQQKSDHAGVCAWKDSPTTGVASGTSTAGASPAKRSDYVRLEQCLLSTEKGLSALKSELRRVGGPYAVTPSLHVDLGEMIERGHSTTRGHSPRGIVTERGGGRHGASSAASFTAVRSPSARGRRLGLATPRCQPSRGRAERLSKSMPPRSDAAVKRPSGSPQPSDMRRTLVRETSRRVAAARDNVSPLGSSAKCERSLPKQGPTKGHTGNTEIAAARGLSPKLEALISDDEKQRFRAAWKEAHAQLAAKMNEWVHGLPEEIRNQVTRASGVDAKFLMLRDYALTLCSAAENRTATLSDARVRNDESMRCQGTEHYKAGTMLVEVQGGLLAASKKVQQLDRLIRLTLTQRRFSEQQVKSTHDNGSATKGSTSPYTAYTSIYSSDLPRKRNFPGGDCPVPVERQKALGEPWEESLLGTDGHQQCESTPAIERAVFINEDDTLDQTVVDAARTCGYSSHTPSSTSEGTDHHLWLSSDPPCTSSARHKSSEINANNESLTQRRQPCRETSKASADLSLSVIPPEGLSLNEDVSWAQSFISDWYANRR